MHHHNLFNDKAELYESSRPIYPQEIYSYLANLCPSTEYFNYLHTFSATRRCMDSIGNEFFDKAYEEVGYLWGSSEKSNKIALDFVFYAGRKII